MQEREEKFRPLSQEELELEVRAMRWLYKKGISIEDIRRFTVYQTEGNCVAKYYPLKHFAVRRVIPFSNTPLEAQIKALPALKSRFRIFPKKVWTKRKIQGAFVPIWSEAEIRSLLGLKPKKEPKAKIDKESHKIILTLDF